MTGFIKGVLSRIERQVEPFILGRQYPNFYWSLLWQFTSVCNARCVYCGQEKASSHPDVFAAFEKVKRLKPKDLLLMGGEPFCFPGIIELLRAIKDECENPYLTLSTNLSVNMERVKESLPLLDQLQVSLDATGDVNRELRSFDGDLIAERLGELWEYVREEGLHTGIFTHSIVTSHNDHMVDEFVEGLQKRAPGIKMGFSFVEPYTHPLSITGKPERFRRFVATIVRLKEKHPVNICDRLIQPDKSDKIPVSSNFESPYDESSMIAPRISCRRQFFFAFMMPGGKLHTCHPHMFYVWHRNEIRELMNKQEYWKAAKRVLRMIDQLVLRPYDPTCYYPCKCQRFIEDILEAGRVGRVTHEIERIAGKFTRGELATVQEFLLARYNERLPREVMEKLAEAGN